MKIKFNQQRLDLLWQLVKTSFKMRYQNSILGVLWVLIKPYSTFLVMYVIWSRFGGQTVENYAVYLLLGIVTYTFFQELLIFGQLALLDRAHIILKVSFPRQIAIASALVSALINLLINLSLAILIMLYQDVQVTLWGLLYYFFIVGIIFVFSLAVSFYISIVTVRFRDLKNILELGLFILYWASPIFYVLESNPITSGHLDLLSLNPVAFMLEQSRAAFGIHGQINVSISIIYLMISLALLSVSWRFFTRQVRKVAEYF